MDEAKHEHFHKAKVIIQDMIRCKKLMFNYKIFVKMCYVAINFNNY